MLVKACSSVITAVRKTKTKGSTNAMATAMATAFCATHESNSFRVRRRRAATCLEPNPRGRTERSTIVIPRLR